MITKDEYVKKNKSRFDSLSEDIRKLVGNFEELADNIDQVGMFFVEILEDALRTRNYLTAILYACDENKLIIPKEKLDERNEKLVGSKIRFCETESEDGSLVISMEIIEE